MWKIRNITLVYWIESFTKVHMCWIGSDMPVLVIALDPLGMSRQEDFYGQNNTRHASMVVRDVSKNNMISSTVNKLKAGCYLTVGKQFFLTHATCKNSGFKYPCQVIWLCGLDERLFFSLMCAREVWLENNGTNHKDCQFSLAASGRQSTQYSETITIPRSGLIIN